MRDTRLPVGGFGRGLDACFNRWTEALRTVEDRLRFDLGLQAAPFRWRELRHRVGALRARVEDAIARQGAGRAVESDPGAPTMAAHSVPSPTQTAAHRDLWDLLRANVARARESARSIEETLRVVDLDLSAEAEAIRYAIYDREHEVVQWRNPARARLAEVNLYVLVTASLATRSPVATAAAALAGGAQMIQLREKHMPHREVLALARDLREVTLAHRALFIVNDYVDIALLCGADGVHQGQEDLSVADARRILGADSIIGVSTHCRDQAERATLDGADYIGVGPIFPTNTKEHRTAVGLPYIAEAQAITDVPAFAIGSVNRDTLPQVLAAGAQRVAICTGIIADPDIEGATRWFRERLTTASEPTSRAIGGTIL